MKKITDLRARQILDSRGNPTVEVDCVLDDRIMGRASVPSGASTGTHEALELRDNNPERFLGRGVKHAVENVNTVIREKLVGMDATDQFRVDCALLELDGTENKSRLGANAMLGVSLAVCRAAAVGAGIPIYRLLGGVGTRFTPTPMLNVINGGAHASNNLDIQEYMIIPSGFERLSEALRAASEIFQTLKKMLAKAGKATTVGDEGGFAPDFEDNEAPLRAIVEAIEAAGYEPGRHICLALDAAASEFFCDDDYLFKNPVERRMSADELVGVYEKWLGRYPIISIEDGLAESDWEGWEMMTRRLGERVQVVGDDIFVTNVARLGEGIGRKVANAVLIKPNQIGTVSETLDCVKLAADHGYRTVISHRSSETDDHFIADLAVAVNSGQIKTGAPCRGERVAKYNRLIRIEEQDGLPYAALRTLRR
ncbi:MAG TPA: phosphopyruvate hydratase [candidate division WOR-3 bacterium]|uniref:Enolase n=1 Tax=candidate division WOR-3 bacterium TaxID=2052148 RepID=A0A7V0T4P7_UNCW3|nr:phosphopyruvate hydratase [candidate division WOR-3 bacterium]